MSETSTRIRAEFAAQDAIRDAGLTVPSDIAYAYDIPYGSQPLQQLDIYRPKNTDAPLPVIINVHGGGWVYGDKELYRYYAMSLAQRGFAVVNFSYRLAPESRFPAQLEDIASVFSWALDHANEYGLDMENLFAVGDSAGAHLLGLYCAACADSTYAAKVSEATHFGPMPKGVSFACGAYSFSIMSEDDQSLILLEDLLGEKPTPENMRLVDVLSHITPAFPRTFFFTCTGDFLQEQARALQAALMENSVPHILRFYGDAKHQLGHVFHCNMRSEAAKQCNDDQCAFFRSLM